MVADDTLLRPTMLIYHHGIQILPDKILLRKWVVELQNQQFPIIFSACLLRGNSPQTKFRIQIYPI